MSAYFVQALIISTLYKAVHLTAVWGGYYCCFHFTDDEAEAQEQGVCGTGPGNHPTQCSDSGSWARVLTTFFTWFPASLKGIAMSWKLLPKDMRLQNLNGIIYFDSKLKFHFLHLVDFGLKDSGLNVEDGVGQAFVTQMVKGSVCTTASTPHLQTRAPPPWKQSGKSHSLRKLRSLNAI